MSASDGFAWSDNNYSVKDVLEYSNKRLPVVVKVTQIAYGFDRSFPPLDTSAVYLLNEVRTRQRVAMRSSESGIITFPLDSNDKFCIAYTSAYNSANEEMKPADTLKNILENNALCSELGVYLEGNPHMMLSCHPDLRKPTLFEPLEVIGIYEESALLGCKIETVEKLGSTFVTILPGMLITLEIATGLAGGNETDDFQKCLDAYQMTWSKDEIPLTISNDCATLLLSEHSEIHDPLEQYQFVIPSSRLYNVIDLSLVSPHARSPTYGPPKPPRASQTSSSSSTQPYEILRLDHHTTGADKDPNSPSYISNSVFYSKLGAVTDANSTNDTCKSKDVTPILEIVELETSPSSARRAHAKQKPLTKVTTDQPQETAGEKLKNVRKQPLAQKSPGPSRMDNDVAVQKTPNQIRQAPQKAPLLPSNVSFSTGNKPVIPRKKPHLQAQKMMPMRATAVQGKLDDDSNTGECMSNLNAVMYKKHGRSMESLVPVTDGLTKTRFAIKHRKKSSSIEALANLSESGEYNRNDDYLSPVQGKGAIGAFEVQSRQIQALKSTPNIRRSLPDLPSACRAARSQTAADGSSTFMQRLRNPLRNFLHGLKKKGSEENDVSSDDGIYEEIEECSDFHDTSEPETATDNTVHKISRNRWQSVRSIPQDISSFSVSEVAECLRLLKMGRYAEEFTQQDVDGKLLLTMDEEMLRTGFNMSPLETMKLVQFINGWRPKK